MRKERTTMNEGERGQGLVEYSLILVLVAMAVIALLVLLGPAIDDVFCEIMQVLDETYVCGPYTTVSVAATMDSGQQPPLEWDDAKEKILALWEEAKAQEEGLQEGTDLVVEALGEGLEVLVDYAGDGEDPLLYESLSALLQQVRGGNLEAVPNVIASLLDELGEMPSEVGTAMSLKVAPRLIGGCEAVSGGTVSADTIAAAVEAVQQLDDAHPGKAEALQLLQEAAEMIEGRNEVIGSYLDGGAYTLDLIIAGLELAGEGELAAEIEAASEACGY
jgi:pilus assembly protein Flp/PilA